MTCLRLKSNKPGVPDGFVCGFELVYEYDGYLFEVHRYHGPMTGNHEVQSAEIKKGRCYSISR